MTQKFTTGQKVRIIKTEEVGTVVRYDKEYKDLCVLLVERANTSRPVELLYNQKALEALIPPESLCGFNPGDRVEIIERCLSGTVYAVSIRNSDEGEWFEILVTQDDDISSVTGPWAPSELRKIESTVEPDSPLPAHSGNKYHRRIQCLNQHGTFMIVDVYCVIDAFGVTCPAIQHALKKLLCPGKRGKGDTLQDLNEARDAMTRAIELETNRHYQEPT